MRVLLLARVVLVVGLAAAVGLLGAAGVAAASKYKACSLLTAAEVEAVLKKKVSKTVEGDDITIKEGTYKGEVVSRCDWVAGQGALGTYVTLSVTRGPRNPQERADGLALLKDTFAQLKKQGWSIQEKEFGGVGCATGRAPAGTSGVADFASCVAEKRGLALDITIAAVGLQVSMEQVKSLTDKAASRIR